MKAIIEKNLIRLPPEEVKGLEYLSQPVECEVLIEENILHIRLPVEITVAKMPLQRMIEDIKRADILCDVDLMAKALEVDDVLQLNASFIENNT